ncbi:tryptophan 2,3-dioxygenase [Rhodospirillaceae bacterium KN72]|uniref:Tryptophan 2,3-dioxygenase n=1 Tax=Pacificispira spongiicola TaxID=2729598 RepID=A0A7Y0E0M1_9PROT|nr:tryptophan 2,3-dioxygenase family protein [Pacificispira spongiicola]NMM45026.1 tryptophan 2,3-dioxygenase [Pacificispira spongiicola]
MDYADYLGLDGLFECQNPQSDAHDELLFIIQHQTSELWMRLALHELHAARTAILAGEIQPSFKMLARVARIFEQLNSAWDVLRTMTPSEYTRFRPSLGGSSGFQSFQYREIEFLLGNRNPAMIDIHKNRPDVMARLRTELERPSLYDAAISMLCGAGFDIAPETTHRALDRGYHPDPSVEAAWKAVYGDPGRHWDLYEMGEKLVDLEDYFRRWRFNHVTTVERVIGAKPGTGGTGGVTYLRKMLETVLFPELWSVRTSL